MSDPNPTEGASAADEDYNWTLLDPPEEENWTVIYLKDESKVRSDYYRATFDDDFTRVLAPKFPPKRRTKSESESVGFLAYDLKNQSDIIPQKYGKPGSAILVSQSDVNSSQAAVVLESSRNTVVFLDMIGNQDQFFSVAKKTFDSSILRIQLCSEYKILVVSTLNSLVVLSVPSMGISNHIVVDQHLFAACKGTIAYTQSKVNDGKDVYIIRYDKTEPHIKFTPILPEAVEHMCFDKHCTMLAIASKDGYTIRIHDVAAITDVLHVLGTNDYNTVIQTMTICGSYLLVTTNMRDVLLYDLTLGYSKHAIAEAKKGLMYSMMFDHSAPKRGPGAVMQIPEIYHKDVPRHKAIGGKNIVMLPKNAFIRKSTDGGPTLQGVVTYGGRIFLYDISDRNYIYCKFVTTYSTLEEDF